MEQGESPRICVTRLYCPNEDRGEMICTGIILPVFDGDPVQYLCECTICGALEVVPYPFPMAYPIDGDDMTYEGL